MAESVILVCDRCGKPAVGTMRLEWESKRFEVDRCKKHASEDLAGARRPRRGRKPTYANA